MTLRPAVIYCHGENRSDERDAITECRSCGRRRSAKDGPGALECAACRSGAPLPASRDVDLAPSAGLAMESPAVVAPVESREMERV